MRETEVTVFNRKGLGSHTVTIKFDTLDEFKKLTDSVIDATEFYKVYLEFDTDIFTTEEIENLKAENFI